MKKIVAIVTLFVMLITMLSGCTKDSSSGTESNKKEEKAVTVSKVVSKNGRTYVEYKEQPYLMYGIQMRFDNLRSEKIMDLNVYEEYFKRAKEAGFKSVLVPVLWIETEIKEDVYDFFYLEKYIEWCDKYGLDLQIVWFGSAVCGYSTLPGYIWEDKEKYPRNQKYPEFAEFSYEMSDPDFRDRMAKRSDRRKGLLFR